MKKRIRTAVLISGYGSNLQALIDAAKAPDYPAEIILVISNVADAYGLTRAQTARIKTVVIPHGDYPTREAFDAKLDETLRTHHTQLICLAGFMRILSATFTEAWARRVINIHPSLLPRHKGLHTHARVLAAGEREHGATVHWVTPELDSGAIILQESLAVRAEDTEATLKQRIHEIEHRIYPLALAHVATSLL